MNLQQAPPKMMDQDPIQLFMVAFADVMDKLLWG